MYRILLFLLFGTFLFSNITKAQTDYDAIMMEKSQLCIGPMYSNSSWKNYWEGTTKRDNSNLGKVSAKMLSVMGAYGISNKLNLLFNASYVKTSAFQGTMHGMKGVQDLNLFIKWLPVEKQLGPGTFSLYLIGGGSLPLTNYVADYQPLAIGMHSKSALARLMLDYQLNHLFFTASSTYIWRNNVMIDRTAYYTTELHYSNEVEMPDAGNFNFRGGFRSSKLIAEAVVNKFTTLGGFDISRNNMPFLSNRMNATTIGVNMKYVLTAKQNLSVVAGGSTTVAGRNVGQASDFYGSIFYVLDFNPKTKTINKAVESH